MYRCVATSIEGFIQQLAVGYIARGYHFYSVGSIPEGKDREAVDRKIIEKYGIAVSKFTRCRSNKLGIAPIQYLRFESFFVIIAKYGKSRFWFEEGHIQNTRIRPIRFAGYSVSSKQGRDGKWHASVRIELVEFNLIKKRFIKNATRLTLEQMCRQFIQIRFVPYAPVRDQLRILLRAVNRLRKTAGLETVPFGVLPYKIKPVKPFERKKWKTEFTQTFPDKRGERIHIVEFAQLYREQDE